MKKLLQVLVITIFFSSSILAGGFQTGTQNARAMGMGSAFVGMVPDASAIYFNPAGLSNIRGFNLVAGTTLIMPTVDFSGPTPSTNITSTVDRTFTPINFYAAYALDNGFSFGIGVNNPYGLGTEWPTNWIGSSLAVKTELRTFYITPALSYKINDQFSVGVGFSYIVSDVLFQQNANLPPIQIAPGVFLPAGPNVGIKLEGDGDAAYTFNVGLLFKATEDISVGVSYRHSAEITFNGDLIISNLPNKPANYPVGHSDLFPSGKGVAKITMPYDLRAGVSFNATQDLTINADVMYVGWESYKELAVDFDKNTLAWGDLKSPKNWENSIGLKLGGEYRMNDLAFRAGYVFDGSPIPTAYMDPTLPGSDRHEFTVGIGYQLTPSIRIDAAYQYISFSQDISDSKVFNNPPPTYAPVYYNGKYENSTNLFGFNLALSL